jgi:hypothetical protein
MNVGNDEKLSWELILERMWKLFGEEFSEFHMSPVTPLGEGSNQSFQRRYI